MPRVRKTRKTIWLQTGSPFQAAQRAAKNEPTKTIENAAAYWLQTNPNQNNPPPQEGNLPRKLPT
jgi:hypothetical protein